MLLRLLLAFTLIPLVEIYLLVRVGSHIGVWPTIAIVLVTGTVGAWLARAQGLSVMARIRDDMARGVPPTGQLVDALLILLAGVLLITPGLLTDASGLCLLVPPVRRAVRAWLSQKFTGWTAQGRVHVVHGGSPFGGPFQGQRQSPFGDSPRQEKVINPEPHGREPRSGSSDPGGDELP